MRIASAMGKIETSVHQACRHRRVVDIGSGRVGPEAEGVRLAAGNGHFFVVSAEDAPKVQDYNWHVCITASGGNIYIFRNFWTGGVQRRVYLHRYLLEPNPSVLVDHRNGDGCDNTRGNLRLADTSQNVINRPTPRPGICGVYRRRRGTYHIVVQANGIVHRSTYADLASALEARDQLALKLHGEFAQLNLGARGV